MSYDSVLPLSEVKIYLRIDEDFTETDGEIQKMRDAACSYIEKQTNHFLYNRSKSYFKLEGDIFIDVYDFPINNIPSGVDKFMYANKTRYDANSIELNVGYEDPTEIPSELIQVALQIIKYWYFDSESNVSTNIIPQELKNILFSYKRFIA